VYNCLKPLVKPEIAIFKIIEENIQQKRQKSSKKPSGALKSAGNPYPPKNRLYIIYLPSSLQSRLSVTEIVIFQPGALPGRKKAGLH